MAVKCIDCGTIEVTKGTEKARIKYSGNTATYNGKICEMPNKNSFSKSQMEKACKEAHDNNRDYYEILENDWNDCLKKNNFPEWFN